MWRVFTTSKQNNMARI